MTPSNPSRRQVLRSSLLGAAALAAGGLAETLVARAAAAAAAAAPDLEAVSRKTLEFIRRCARDDGGYRPSPDPDYAGNSDTSASDLAAVTYAAVLARTMNWELANPDRSIAFVHAHQEADGRFVNHAGSMKRDDPLAVLYNTTQGAVALRALGARPKVDPSPVMDRFFEGDAHKKLPWYTTSFFPLFYAAAGKPFPERYDKAIAGHMVANQKDDGYLQDHVASTFHMAHYFRMLGRETPKAAEMVRRTVRDQKDDGGWDIKEPDWDVHACFDALYVLRQLGDGDDPDVQRAIAKGGAWALRCQNADGGFGHYPGWHSDMDAVYFNFGSLVQAGMAPGARLDLPDGHLLGWGHAMKPGKVYGAD